MGNHTRTKIGIGWHRVCRTVLLLHFALLLGSTSLPAQDDGLLSILHAPDVGISFRNDVKETEESNIFTAGMLYLHAGGGVAVGDVDGNGYPDLLFVGNQVPSRLYLNQGDWQFRDATEDWGIRTDAWCTGAVMADVNGDGWLDIYVLKARNNEPNTGGNLLFINQGGKGFEEQAAQYGLALNGRFISCSFFDMDGDGDLDLYLPSYPDNSQKERDLSFDLDKVHPQKYGNDLLLENKGNNSFVNVAAQMQLPGENGFGISVITPDLDGDGQAEIFVANDFIAGDFLWYKNKNSGKFSNQIEERFSHSSFFSMGVESADLDNDLLPDLLSLDMNPPSLKKLKTDFSVFNFNMNARVWEKYPGQEIRNHWQRQNPSGHFSEIGQVDKFAFTDWSWSVLATDLDLDGWKDIFVTNGLKKDIQNSNIYLYELDSIRRAEEKEWHQISEIELLSYIPASRLKNYFFRNKQGRGLDLNHNWVKNQVSVSNGAAYADLDLDGDMDLVTNDLDTFPLIYKNLARERLGHAYIGFIPRQDDRLAYGTKAVVFQQGRRQVQELINARGFQSSSQPLLHFGLGENPQIDSVLLFFPNGNTRKLQPKPNQYLDVTPESGVSSSIRYTSLRPTPAYHLHPLAHWDTLVIDNRLHLSIQPLLHREYAQKSPHAFACDIDGDGWEEVLLGGYAGRPARLATQQKDGSLQLQTLPDLPHSNPHSGFAYADINGDGRRELIISSCDFTHHPDSVGSFLSFYQCEKKHGEWQTTRAAFSYPVPFPVADMAVADFDGDGQTNEIALVEQSTALGFPKAARLWLLSLNSEGDWVLREEQTGILNPSIEVLDADGNKDLCLAGHFGGIEIWRNDGSGRFVRMVELQGKGAWNKTQHIDLDGDGITERIALNMGLNHRFNLLDEEAIVIHAQDFDGNGQVDPVVCVRQDKRDYPIYNNMEFTERFPLSRKTAYDSRAYGGTSLDGIFPESPLDANAPSITQVETTLFSGEEWQALPEALQWTEMNDVWVDTLEQKIYWAGNSDNYRSDWSKRSGAATLMVLPYTKDRNGDWSWGELEVLNPPGWVGRQFLHLHSPEGGRLVLVTNQGLFEIRALRK